MQVTYNILSYSLKILKSLTDLFSPTEVIVAPPMEDRKYFSADVNNWSHDEIKGLGFVQWLKNIKEQIKVRALQYNSRVGRFFF